MANVQHENVYDISQIDVNVNENVTNLQRLCHLGTPSKLNCKHAVLQQHQIETAKNCDQSGRKEKYSRRTKKGRLAETAAR